jgi:GMP synthase (glutamine-hydrolysing)
MTVQPADTILIVDFGSQVTQLIARRVRETGAYSEIAPFNAADEAFERLRPKGIILSGGPSSVMWDDSPRAPQHFFEAGVPILGICYGQQTMAHQLGGQVAPVGQPRVRRAFIEVTGGHDPVRRPVGAGELHQVWMSHGDRVERLPGRFRVVAQSPGAPYAVAVDEARRFFSLMFHPKSSTRRMAASSSPISSVMSAASRRLDMAEFRAAKMPKSVNRSAPDA